MNAFPRFLARRSYHKDLRNLKFETIGSANRVALVKLDRRRSLNSLSTELIEELHDVLSYVEGDKNLKVTIVTGTPKYFSIGADIGELSATSFAELYQNDFLKTFDKLRLLKKPIIAAVSGMALGGGCELAMLCDIAHASENAIFAQPEVLIGTIPGAGGTQLLTRSARKSFAMEHILTGNRFNAREALKFGIVSKIHPTNNLLEEVIKLADAISEKDGILVQAIKESVNRAFESNLTDGIKSDNYLQEYLAK